MAVGPHTGPTGRRRSASTVPLPSPREQRKLQHWRDLLDKETGRIQCRPKGSPAGTWPPTPIWHCASGQGRVVTCRGSGAARVGLASMGCFGGFQCSGVFLGVAQREKKGARMGTSSVGGFPLLSQRGWRGTVAPGAECSGLALSCKALVVIAPPLQFPTH